MSNAAVHLVPVDPRPDLRIVGIDEARTRTPKARRSGFIPLEAPESDVLDELYRLDLR